MGAPFSEGGNNVTYGEFKSFVLGLINQAQARGVELDDTYNDQADYLQRIPGLYNAAMVELASEAVKLVGVMSPVISTTVCPCDGFVAISVPDDFISMTGDGIPVIRNGKMTREKGYYMVGEDTVMVRDDLVKNGVLEYRRCPQRLPMDPANIDDSKKLDGTYEMQAAAAYYTAAMLVLQDDAFAYSALRNEYDDKLSGMKKRLCAEMFTVNSSCDIVFNPY